MPSLPQFVEDALRLHLSLQNPQRLLDGNPVTVSHPRFHFSHSRIFSLALVVSYNMNCIDEISTAQVNIQQIQTAYSNQSHI